MKIIQIELEATHMLIVVAGTDEDVEDDEQYVFFKINFSSLIIIYTVSSDTFPSLVYLTFPSIFIFLTIKESFFINK